MAKRNRPIMYEVFGSQTRMRGLDGPPSGKTARSRPLHRGRVRRAMGELRISYELAATIGLLVVVLSGTLYYFGWVRGQDPADEVTLMAGGETGNGREAGPAPTPPRDPGTMPATETYWSVRVITTGTWTKVHSEAKILDAIDRAFDTKDFLDSRHFEDVHVVRYDNKKKRSYVAVYVGRSESDASLKPLLARLKRLRWRKKTPFASAFVVQLSPR
ncbi:MAG: hypothetical protein CMJ83_06915 [Planctomycetes bacterium]|nr:hypothetical protein [Planctomycetota bacterium]